MRVSSIVAAAVPLDVGDRTLAFVRPPLFDSPASTGVYDVRTGTYWAVDCFGLPVTAPVDDARDIDQESFGEASAAWAGMLSPWHTMLDQSRFDAAVDRVVDLGAATIANAHGPVLRGDRIARTLEVTRSMPSRPAAVWPGQVDLESLLQSADA